MKLPARPRPATVRPGVVGRVRVRRTGEVARQVEAGDLLVVDERDLDAVTARAIRDRRPAAVLNLATFVSGRVPNLGPGILAEAGIPLIEAPEASVLKDGAQVRLDGGTVYAEDEPVVEGHLVSPDELGERTAAARGRVAAHLTSFVHNATELLRREEAVLLHGTGVPDLATTFTGRAAVVVSGDAEAGDLRRLKRFLRERGPVVVGVDEGAALLVARHLRPDVLVLSESAIAAGTVPTEVLRQARDVVVPTPHEGPSHGLERLQRHSVHPRQFVTATTAYDAALLLSRHNGAELVVPVGRVPALDDLVDGSRSGQASAFVTRMALGRSMVDSEAVPHLYAGRTPAWLLLLVLLAGLVAVAIAVAVTPVGHDWWLDVQHHLSLLLPTKDRP